MTGLLEHTVYVLSFCIKAVCIDVSPYVYVHCSTSYPISCLYSSMVCDKDWTHTVCPRSLVQFSWYTHCMDTTSGTHTVVPLKLNISNEHFLFFLFILKHDADAHITGIIRSLVFKI